MLARAAVAALVAGSTIGGVTAEAVADPSNGASGAMVAISQSGLTYVSSEVLSPLLENELNDLKLPDVDTEKDGIKIHIGNMKTYDFDCKDCVKIAIVPGKGLQLDITDFDIKLHSRYELKKIISTGGECESKLSGADVSGLVSIGLSSDGHPTLSISNVNAAVEKVDLGCKGVSGSLLNALADVFKKDVTKALQDAVQQAVPPVIKSVSDSLEKVNLDLPITDNFAEVRFDLSGEPNITASWVSVPTLGTVAPMKAPGQVAPYAIPPLPSFDDSEQAFVQVLLSDYTMNSAAYTYWLAGRLATVVNSSMLPPTLPLQLNTSSLAAIAPGLAVKYPNTLPMQLYVGADPLSKPQVEIHPSGLQVSMPSLLTFQVLPGSGQPTQDAFTLSCPAAIEGTLSISGQSVTGDLSSGNCTLAEYNSTVGTVNVAVANQLAVYVINGVVLPLINKVANAGIPIPPVGDFKLSNARVKMQEKYAVVAADLSHK